MHRVVLFETRRIENDKETCILAHRLMQSTPDSIRLTLQLYLEYMQSRSHELSLVGDFSTSKKSHDGLEVWT
jgi:hypothetical protein